MKLRFTLLLVLLASLLAQVCRGVTGTNDAFTLVWNGYANMPGVTNYVVYHGTNSGRYLTNWPVTGTNYLMTLNKLFPGTNYFALKAFQSLGGTNVIGSDLSREAKYARLAPPSLQIEITLLSGTNLAMLTTTQAVFDSLVEITPGQKYFVAKLTSRLLP